MHVQLLGAMLYALYNMILQVQKGDGKCPNALNTMVQRGSSSESPERRKDYYQLGS